MSIGYALGFVIGVAIVLLVILVIEAIVWERQMRRLDAQWRAQKRALNT